MFRLITILSACAALCACASASDRSEVRKFPDGFLFGAATASYQVEGAWNADDKSESIYDHLLHTNPCIVKDCSNGDIADDSYHQYKRDVEMIRELGLDFYRFSISWPRIMPTSFPDKISKSGVQYYNSLIDELLKYNIQPMVTMFHWDLPQKLQDMGGWTNPYIVDWFADYARVVLEQFGDRVGLWLTINEPNSICKYGYGDVVLAPVLNIAGYADYLCAKNLLLAHAKVYHMYNEEFKPLFGGNMGIGLDAQYYVPLTDSEADIEAATDHNLFLWRQYADPLFSEKGDFPSRMKERVAAKSAEQGFSRSRLPELSQEEIDYIRGTADFFVLNHYTTLYTYRNESAIGAFPVPSSADDLGVLTYQPEEWTTGESEYFVKHTPWGFYQLLNEIRERYNNPIVYITENGFSTPTGLEDNARVNYYKDYLAALLDAIEDGCNIRGYTAWSLMDNFEWFQGYSERFGLYEVDYSDPLRPRTPRKSAFVYKQIVRTRKLDLDYEPNTTGMTIDEGH